MKKQLHKDPVILIPYKIFLSLLIIIMLESNIVESQNSYSLQLSDTSTYDNNCGKTLPSQWSVKNDSCVLFTPYFRKETIGCMDVNYDFIINQSGNGDTNDLAYVQIQFNDVWTTDTIMHASDYAAVHELTGKINICYGDIIRLRVALKTNDKTEFWAIMSGDMTLTGDFETYSGYPPTLPSLPVELTSYRIKCVSTGSLLTWTTASEINNDYFSVEKTEDMLGWRIVTTISGAFNSNNEIQYSTIDTVMVPDKVTYYRLKQTDTDGKFKYFDVLAILCSFSNDILDIIGVNVSGKGVNLIVKTDGLTALHVYLSDISGKIISQKDIEPVKGANIVSLNVSGLSKGIYVANVFQNGKTLSKKIYLSMDN